MWCPKCKSEYVAGITECPECKVRLVDRLPDESAKRTEYIEYVELLTALKPPEVALVRSILDGSDVVYYIKGEQSLHTAYGFLDARLMVRKDHLDKARELLREFTRDR